MKNKSQEHSVQFELNSLKKKFATLKGDTEQFVTSAHKLSEMGAKGAKDLVKSAKSNWRTVITRVNKSPISGLFSGRQTARPSKVGKKQHSAIAKSKVGGKLKVKSGSTIKQVKSATSARPKRAKIVSKALKKTNALKKSFRNHKVSPAARK